MRYEVRFLEVTPRQAVGALKSDLHLSIRNLGTILGTDPRNIQRWVSGESYPQRTFRRRLHGLVELHRHLGETFVTMEAAREWLAAPSRYLAGLTPLDALRAGRVDRVENALEAIDSGVFL